MSQRLISRSPDLKRLRDDGYAVTIRHGHLLVASVPYVDAQRQVRRGTLVSTLTLAADTTTTPDTHVVTFIGELPCTAAGVPLTQIVIGSDHQHLAPDIVVQHTFSSKPPEDYPDYYAKMTAYAAMLEGPAQSVEPGITVRTYAPVIDDEGESVFAFVDTAESRAGIAAINDRLRVGSVAIVGLGGTGSYVLDLVAKTPVQEIRLIDGDTFQQHNAFRSPGAPTVAQLREAPSKAAHFAAIYGQMHRGIRAHPVRLDETNLDLLDGTSFVFLCIDDGEAKAVVIDHLAKQEVPFVDVGIGVYEVDGRLGGALRVTAGTGVDGVERARSRISLGAPDPANEYARNIQVADLNMLNAAQAVVKWKKHTGFYLDLERERFSVYEIDGNAILNEDQEDQEDQE